MRYLLPLVLLVALVVVMAGGGRRTQQTRSLGFVFLGIAIALTVFFLILSRAL